MTLFTLYIKLSPSDPCPLKEKIHSSQHSELYDKILHVGYLEVIIFIFYHPLSVYHCYAFSMIGPGERHPLKNEGKRVGVDYTVLWGDDDDRQRQN